MEFIRTKGIVCLFESMDFFTMVTKADWKPSKGVAPCKKEPLPLVHPWMLADFTLCRSNQKGRKSVEAVRERVTPKLGRKTRNKKTPLLRRCRGMKERFSNGGMGGTVVPLSRGSAPWAALIGKPRVCYNLPSPTLYFVSSPTLYPIALWRSCWSESSIKIPRLS